MNKISMKFTFNHVSFSSGEFSNLEFLQSEKKDPDLIPGYQLIKTFDFFPSEPSYS